jgi:hypothetical protein
VVAVNPDHPELFEGPDILAGLEGRLLAVFSLKRKEARDVRRLATRVLLTRLALPSHARCVLLLDEEDSTEINHPPHIGDVSSLFHVARPFGPRRLTHVLRDVNADDGQKEIPTSVRQHVYERYAFLLDLSRSAFRGIMLQAPEARATNGRRLAHSHAQRPLQRYDVPKSAMPALPKIRVADEGLWANQMVVKDEVAIAYRLSDVASSRPASPSYPSCSATCKPVSRSCFGFTDPGVGK